ncbi:hypothetical protein [Vagococcus lutrae]|uniref:hypothetical protein n=1 Tax=Vagococcus lutrae TaxID=81947 RepID=UPI0028915424|nr:hypothetical protein [Vagococcus lutrae]MDT2844699.1 hypothetical protein [Vagococcus lutrae]
MYKITRLYNDIPMHDGQKVYFDEYQGEYVDKSEMKRRVIEAFVDETFDEATFDSIVAFAGFDKRIHKV